MLAKFDGRELAVNFPLHLPDLHGKLWSMRLQLMQAALMQEGPHNSIDLTGKSLVCSLHYPPVYSIVLDILEERPRVLKL
jgi:hypothetical protein